LPHAHGEERYTVVSGGQREVRDLIHRSGESKDRRASILVGGRDRDVEGASLVCQRGADLKVSSGWIAGGRSEGVGGYGSAVLRDDTIRQRHCIGKVSVTRLEVERHIGAIRTNTLIAVVRNRCLREIERRRRIHEEADGL